MHAAESTINYLSVAKRQEPGDQRGGRREDYISLFASIGKHEFRCIQSPLEQNGNGLAERGAIYLSTKAGAVLWLLSTASGAQSSSGAWLPVFPLCCH